MPLQVKQWSTNWGGRTLTLETGRYALLTDATVTARYGDTVVMATVVQSKTIREELDFFPLQVSFEEKFYAAGKIKGGRFMKREGKPSDEAVLTGRLVDRAIRPLFDDRIRNEIQVVLTALAVDGENDAATTAFIAASAALSISSIPWAGPIGASRVGKNKETGEFILNPTFSELEEVSDLDLVVAGTPEKLIMVEAGATEVPENIMLEAMKWGNNELQPAIELIQKMVSEVGQEKKYPENIVALKKGDLSESDKAKEMAKVFIRENADTYIFDRIKISRAERSHTADVLKEALKAYFTEQGIEEEFQSGALNSVKQMFATEITRRILEKDERLDGRKLTDIRELNIAVDLLPRVHGSGMFMRGDTQVLSIVTLGAPGDVQTLETMEEEGTKRYMHHYNDAPYSYGEAGMMRGPGRRAIGHGALAERALLPVLPEETDFPYTIRVVSEVLGSNGSSSMASTCGSTLSLMAAGVPIKKPVAGIAMGLASDLENSGTWKVLTDLQDIEDGDGGMDFKITGTRDGITAIQMDTKTKGLTWDIVEQTLKQASEARMYILDTMATVLPAPRTELSEYAPRIETLQINPEKIGDVIGPGGKIIKKIIEDTGVSIDIEQTGRVLITSNDAVAMEKAKKIIIDITKEIEAGEEYDGKVVRLEDFGAFIELLPGRDGLVHVSEIAWERVNKPSDKLKIGDVVKVKVKEIDNLGRVNLSMKALLPRPEGYVEAPPRERGGRPNGGGGRPFQKRPQGGGR